MTLQGDKAADRNWAAFQRADQAGHSEYVKFAERCNAYYLGDQWGEDEIQKLRDEGRPFLTLNQILQVINSIYGHYSQKRADFAFKPRKGAQSSEMANTLTRLVDCVLEKNDFHESVEPQVFMDGLIEDRGYFDVRLDFTKNVLGEIAVTSVNPRSVVLDPDADQYDPATWSEVMVDRWLSLDDVELYYGKEARKRVAIYAQDPNTTYGERSVRYETYGDDATHAPIDHQENRRIKAVRIIERQSRKLGKVRELIDPRTGKTRPVPEKWKDADMNRVARQHNLRVRTRMQKRIRWTVSADHVTLHDDWSPYDDFTIVPYFPIFRRGKPSGIVRHLLDPQEQLNKIESQVLHVINTTANSGWLVESGSLVNMDKNDLENQGASTGIVLEYARNRQPPQKIQPNQIPSGLEQYSHKAGEYIANIPGASALLGEMPNTEVSGVTLDKQKSSALQGLKVVMDNLQFSRKLVARRILHLVQNFYTEPRVYYMTAWREPGEPTEQVAINQRNAAGRVANDVTSGEYEAVISEAPARDTFQEQQFAEALELRQAGVTIPDYHIILHSNLHGKEKIAEESKRLQGLGDPSPMQQKQQQIDLRRQMAEVQHLEAQVQEVMSKAGYNKVRSQSEMSEQQRKEFEALSQHQRELKRIETDLQKHYSDLDKDVQVANIHSESSQEIERYTTLMDALDSEKDRQAQLEQAQLEAQQPETESQES